MSSILSAPSKQLHWESLSEVASVSSPLRYLSSNGLKPQNNSTGIPFLSSLLSAPSRQLHGHFRSEVASASSPLRYLPSHSFKTETIPLESPFSLLYSPLPQYIPTGSPFPKSLPRVLLSVTCLLLSATSPAEFEQTTIPLEPAGSLATKRTQTESVHAHDNQ